jgi:hypothetical protein
VRVRNNEGTSDTQLPLHALRGRTTPQPSLAEQRELLARHGFLWVRNFFSPEQVTLVERAAQRIGAASASLLDLSRQLDMPLRDIMRALPLAPIVVPEAKKPELACRAEDLLTCFPSLESFVQQTVTRFVGELMGEPYLVFKDKLNFKWPGGGAFSPHQDFPAYDFLGPRGHVTAMLSVDAANAANGCLQVAANWQQLMHDALRVDPRVAANGNAVLPFVEGGPMHGSIDPRFLRDVEWLALETRPEDLVLFDSYVPHYSEPNNSAQPRRAFFITHNRAAEGEHRITYYRTKRNDPDNPMFHIGTPTKAKNK